MCRNSHNNKLNSSSNNLIRNINNKLKRNRRILEEICHSDKTKTPKNYLFEKGFDFNVMTGSRKNPKGAVYHFVYDYGYLELENDFYLIVKDNRYK